MDRARVMPKVLWVFTDVSEEHRLSKRMMEEIPSSKTMETTYKTPRYKNSDVHTQQLAVLSLNGSHTVLQM
jgi:hypothetical protein